MTKDQLTAYLKEKYGDLMTPAETGKFDPLFVIANSSDLLLIAQSLSGDPELNFDYLCCASAVDTGKTDQPLHRFEVVYSVASTKKNLRLDRKVLLPAENPEVDTLQPVWAAADWFEREFWELYGINVRNHHNLGQFLLPDDWNQGFPMRKDWDAPDFVRMPEK